MSAFHSSHCLPSDHPVYLKNNRSMISWWFWHEISNLYLKKNTHLSHNHVLHCFYSMVFKFFYSCKNKHMNVFKLFMYEERINARCLLNNIWLLVFNRRSPPRNSFGTLIVQKLVQLKLPIVKLWKIWNHII